MILHHSIISCLSEKAVEEAVRNCEQLKEREQEEDNVTIEELEKKRVGALEVVEKEREIVEQERAVYRNHEQYAVHAIKHDVGSAIPQDRSHQRRSATACR